MKDPVTLAEPIQLGFVQTPDFANMNFISGYELIFIMPLRVLDGGENIFPHCLPDLIEVGAFVLKDSDIPFLPNAPHDHTR